MVMLLISLQSQHIRHFPSFKGTNNTGTTQDGDLKVEHQVKVKFSIGKFKDKVLCDVIPMEACHILLGRPWQFDHKILHNGHTNEITLQHHSKTFVLHPLTHRPLSNNSFT